MQLYPVYLTIVPLFHCNGWTHPWMVPMLGGTMVCCRDVTAPGDLRRHRRRGRDPFRRRADRAEHADPRAATRTAATSRSVVEVFTAGAPPPAATLAAIEPLGFNVTQVYGLTEVYGPATECIWKPEWDAARGPDRAALKARTGVMMAMMEEITVHDDHGRDVPRDGETTGRDRACAAMW